MDTIAARVNPRTINREAAILIEAIDGLTLALNEVSPDTREIIAAKRQWLADRLQEQRSDADRWEATVTALFGTYQP